mgnify:CR=1 FL=1
MFKKIIYLLPLAIISTACSDENDEPGSSYELRTLTFEDTDAKFSPYSFADRSDITIADWSDQHPAFILPHPYAACYGCVLIATRLSCRRQIVN